MNRVAAVVTALAISGCASVNPRPAFEDVDQAVRERTGHSVRWARSVAETDALEEAVREMLREELTVDEAVRIALVNNRALQASFEEIGVSQADLVQAGLLSNPELTGFFRFPHGPASGSNVEVGIAKDFFDFLVLPLRKKLAAVQLEETKLLVGNEVLGVVADVKTAFYTLQARQQLVKRLRLILEVNEASATLARQQNAAGNMNELDLLQNQAVYKQSRVDVAQAEVQVRSDREKLNRLLGLWGPDTDWRVADELPPIPETEIQVERLEAVAMEQRLDVGAARWGVDLVGRALAVKKKTRYFPAGIHIGVETEKDSDRHRVTGPNFALELPLFDTGRASIARLESQLFQSQRQLEALAINARSEVREARDLMLATRDLTEYYGKVLLPERVRILDLTLRQYNMMLKGAYDLLAAKQSEVATERAYVEAWRDYWLSRTELERALGGKLPAHREGANP